MKQTNDLSPLMRQYQSIKRSHPNAILFFRVGDFYEMFFEDAVTASGILEIALTSRDKSKEDAVPLCGIPHHAASTYVAKLIRAGMSVAICDQVEDPSQAKGLVRREVVRTITPGTVVEPDLLEGNDNNYIAAITASKDHWGLALADLSTGEFKTTQFDGPTGLQDLFSEIARMEPREVLMAESDASNLEMRLKQLSSPPRACRFSDTDFDPGRGRQILLDHFQVHSLSCFGCEDIPLAVGAAGGLLRFLQDTQKTALGHITRLKRYLRSDHLILDSIAQRNLELTRRLSDGRKEGCLLQVLDRTRTPMGARLLRSWLLQPLVKIQPIQARHTGINFFLNDTTRRNHLRLILKEIGDMERIIGRVSLETAHARDLIQLKNSLGRLPAIFKCLTERNLPDRIPASPLLDTVLEEWDDPSDIEVKIRQILVDEPPPGLYDGGIIRDGIDPALDELRTISRNGKRWISDLEARERKRTGIDSLKVRYNHVFGYYIEVTKTRLANIPEEYHRRQTLVNAERFITPELKDLETKVVGADDQLRKLEHDIFIRLRGEISALTPRIQSMASAVALLDVLSALAEVAATEQYVRPELHEGTEIRISEGRHPMLENLLSRPDRFIPNDTLLNTESHRLLIITGPNMAGKSTYMRQVALIVIMAQMGSFVPATDARIGLVDRIFTRVGASDDLMGGQSTFMVEMTETAGILHQASSRSLILLDEIGRGTSTFDGVSIAWAVAEYLHDQTRLGARTLFATHYHQLTELALTCPGVRNYNIAVREWNDEIIFLRKIVEGGTDRSYGIQVARLAGLPNRLIQRAKEILANLENGELNEKGQPRLASLSARKPDSTEPASLNLFPEHPNAIERELQNLDIAHLTPIEAINLLHELKKKAEGK